MPVTPAHLIADGEISDLYTYILTAHCGITDPQKSVAAKFDPYVYLINDLIYAEAQLRYLTELVDEGAIETIRHERDLAYERHREAIRRSDYDDSTVRDRYNHMLKQFALWEPPVGEQGTKLKEVARRYVLESLAMAAPVRREPLSKIEPIPWITKEIEDLKSEVSRLRTRMQTQIEMAIDATYDLHRLRDSLEKFRPE